MGAHYERALVLSRQRRDALAVDELKLELADDPHSASARRLMALCEARLGLFVAARMFAEEAISLSPENAYGHYVLALVFYQDKAFDSLGRRPFRWGPMELLRERFKCSEAAVREAIRLDPRNPGYHSLLAFLLGARRQYRESIAEARVGLAIDPSHVDCLRAEALASEALGDRHRAIESSSRAVGSDPTSAHAHVTCGYTLLQAGDYTSALSHFREALRIAPDLGMTREAVVIGMQCQYLPCRMLWRLGWRGGSAAIVGPSRTAGGLLLLLFVAMAVSSIGLPAMDRSVGSGRYLRIVAATLLVLPLTVSLMVFPAANFVLTLAPRNRHLFSPDRWSLARITFPLVLGSLVMALQIAFNDWWDGASMILVCGALLVLFVGTFGIKR